MCDNQDGSDGTREGDAGIDRTGVGWVNVGVYESVDWFITTCPDDLDSKPFVF